jgi:hypothetical protein
MANPLQQASVRRKIYYVAAILLLFTISIFWRGKISIPLSSSERAVVLNKLRRLGSEERQRIEERLDRGEVVEGFETLPQPAPSRVNAIADWLQSRTIYEQASPDALDLRELEQGDPDIVGTALRLGLFGSRGMAVTILWKLAIDKQKKNEWQDFEKLVRTITWLQPNFITPWIYQSWNIAYNVSVENDRLNDMYYYIARGIELLAEGERLNKNSPDMRFQIAFYYQNKFGVSDKVTTLRSLMQLSCIPPDDRDPRIRFRKPDGTLDMVQFQDFVRKNPQLVRRLKENLSMRQPEEIVQFLDDNFRVPTRYDANGRLAKPEAQFPVLPRQFPEGQDEFHPRSENIDDSFDAFHAARAWYEYSLTVVPPPSPEPVGVITLTGEDRFKYRIPRSPALIIFRQGAPRAQSYLAERLAKEGWFDTDTRWYPDERADTEDERWFPRAEGDYGPGEGIPAGTSSYDEWRRAYARWRRHGEANGLVLDLAKLSEYERDARDVPDDPSLLERSDEQLARIGLTRKRVVARQRLRIYNQNRSMTNFPYFLASSEAESDRDTVTARAMLWEAERMVPVSMPQAIELYAQAIARWRAVLLNYPRFHHPDGQNRSDRTDEETYEHFLALVGLLEKGERIETKARLRLEALRALAPVAIDPATEELARAALARDIAEYEAGILVSAADERVQRRVEQLTSPLSAAVSAAAFGSEATLTRAVVESEFIWLLEYKSREAWEARSKDGLWVSEDSKFAVRDRLQLNTPVTQTPASPPTPIEPPTITVPGGS